MILCVDDGANWYDCSEQFFELYKTERDGKQICKQICDPISAKNIAIVVADPSGRFTVRYIDDDIIDLYDIVDNYQGADLR